MRSVDCLPDIDIAVGLGNKDMATGTGTIVPAIAAAIVVNDLIPAGVLVVIVAAAGTNS